MKRGFTLVEIMVVVIIIGVLSAVGIPKIFGVIAKAKAAEVPVAAGTYISLQNAFLHEYSSVGSWKNIGYVAPGNGLTDNFNYSSCINGVIPLGVAQEGMPGWQAANIGNLNDCQSGSAWVVVIDPIGEHDVSYRQIVSSTNCASLTSKWDVGSAAEGMCETTSGLHVVETPEEEPEEEPDDEPETPDEPEGTSSNSPASSAAPASSNSTTSSSSNGGKCEDLKKAAKENSGGGLVCIPECGMVVPSGQAKKYGFSGTKVNSMTDPCGKPASSASNGGSSSSAKSSSSKATAQSSASKPASSASGTTGGTTTGGSTTNTTGSGTTGENTTNDNTTPATPQTPAEQYPGYKGNGTPPRLQRRNGLLFK